ncbi:MFS transporter [Arcanobacterium pinnipediorum]|uniref:MFS transporter n=1 Tax=Arcanobacterium pinnipediorum TaxID=1503041 RepID=A0ABY5AIN9_9ACTO|nr:MFS transporter [Arcanobacterium pinnipediorum]USR79957.1 MFS transporter [Arcanobacterium pinnipediorum]
MAPHEFSVPGSPRIYDRRQLLAVLLIPLMMALVQVSSVNNALPALTQALGSSPSEVQWVLSGYTLAIGVILVPAGRLGDIFGRSSLFMIGLVLFTLASLAAGLAQTTMTLNILRVFQGLGAGILSPQTTGLIVQYFQGKARTQAFALFGLVVSISVAIGPILSGLLIGWFGNDLGWRGGFAVNVPLGVLGLILGARWLPFGKERRTLGPDHEAVQQEYRDQEIAAGNTVVERREKIDIDPVGITLLTVAVLFVMLPFIHPTPTFWILLPLGVVGGVAWIAWEKRYKARGHYPMMDLDLLKLPSYGLGTLTGSLFFLAGPAIMAIVAIYLQNGIGVSALNVGLLTLPNAVFSAIGAMWSGRRAYDNGGVIQVLCTLIIVLSSVALAFIVWEIEHGANFWWATLPLAFQGFSFGAFGAANQTLTMMDVPRAHGGIAGGFLQTGQRMATAISIAMVTGVFFAGQNLGSTSPNWLAGMLLALGLVTFLASLTATSAFVMLRRVPKPIR